jgi:hypothetical protein
MMHTRDIYEQHCADESYILNQGLTMATYSHNQIKTRRVELPGLKRLRL